MIYLLQVSTCWILFYSIYAVFLKKETFFSINRYYLLGTLFTGLVIPLIGQLLPANSASTEVYGAMYAVTLPVVEPTVANQAPLFTWMQAFWLAYGIGAFVVASRMVHGLYRIWHIYQAGERTQKDGYTLVQSAVRHLPFSFFNYIFISKSVRLKGDIEHVLRHE